jgi:N-glycosylase/DNA lyase
MENLKKIVNDIQAGDLKDKHSMCKAINNQIYINKITPYLLLPHTLHSYKEESLELFIRYLKNSERERFDLLLDYSEGFTPSRVQKIIIQQNLPEFEQSNNQAVFIWLSGEPIEKIEAFLRC